MLAAAPRHWLRSTGVTPSLTVGLPPPELRPHMRDFDDNDFPLAYLITFRYYGTWVHGDERGSMDRKSNAYGTPKIPPNIRLQASDTKQLKRPPVKLNAARRRVVQSAVREVCDHRQYILRAIHVRTNHVHTVVTAMLPPEP